MEPNNGQAPNNGPAPKMTTDAETPSYLIPKMNELPVNNSAYYTSLHITDYEGDDTAPGEAIQAPIDPFIQLPDETKRPAVGVLLTQEQGWFMEGLALGELLHSLCLAPGEVTKIAVVDWRRREEANDAAVTSQADQVSNQTEHTLATAEIQQAQAYELQTGNSLSFGSSSQSQASGNAGFLFGGASASTSVASSLGFTASVSTGERNLSALSNSFANQRAQQLSQATRSRRSSSVREVSQSESTEASTRVVANYNRQHALTVQYYEVLQVYQLKTRAVKAQRCVFIPMKVINFDEDNNLSKFRETLIVIATKVGFVDLRQMLMDSAKKEEQLQIALKNQQTVVAERTKVVDATRLAYSANREKMEALLATGIPKAFIGAALSASDKPLKMALSAAHHALSAATKALENIQLSMQVSHDELVQFLQRDKLIFNQLMWMDLDPHRIARLVSSLTYEGKKLGALIDPKPVGVFGNLLALPWHFEKGEEQTAFEQEYLQNPEDASKTSVVLPTEGMFAEAVLGQSNAAEKIDITRFWDWNASPIPILPPEISESMVASRATDTSTADTHLDASQATLQSLQSLSGAQGSGLTNILNALQAGNQFRDMSGTTESASLAGKLADNVAEGATEAAKAALQSQKTYSDTLVNLANSEAGKAAIQLGMATAVPSSKATTMLGGLINQSNAKE